MGTTHLFLVFLRQGNNSFQETNILIVLLLNQMLYPVAFNLENVVDDGQVPTKMIAKSSPS